MDIIKAFNAAGQWLKAASMLSFLKAIRDEDLASCLYYPSDSGVDPTLQCTTLECALRRQVDPGRTIRGR